jgi:tRNA A-37 threonylcarbamoyl transferase component Bud32
MKLFRRRSNLPTDSSDEFVAYSCGSLRGICLKGYEAFDLMKIPWAELKTRPGPNHHLAKSSRTRRVVRTEFAPAGGAPRALYVKRVLIRDLRKRLGCLFNPSKAHREWTAAYRLLAMGLATARPVVCAEQWQGPWLRANYLVTEEIANGRPVRLELEHVRAARERRDLLGQLAEWLWQVHRRGFYHDDCSAQHVFVGPQTARQFYFIDLDNCRFHRATVAWGRRVKNLFQLLRSIPPRWASRTDRFHLIQTYLRISGESRRLRRAVIRMRRLARLKRTSIYL